MTTWGSSPPTRRAFSQTLGLVISTRRAPVLRSDPDTEVSRTMRKVRFAIRSIMFCLLAVLAVTSFAQDVLIKDTVTASYDNCIVHTAGGDFSDEKTSVVFACFENDSGHAVAFVFNIRTQTYHFVVGGVAIDDVINFLKDDDPIVIRMRIGDNPVHELRSIYYVELQRAVATLEEDDWSDIAYYLTSGSEELIYKAGDGSVIRIPIYKYSIEHSVDTFGTLVNQYELPSTDDVLPDLN